MNTKLQNKAWSVLPKEFKKELNEIYFNAVVYHPCGYNHKTDLLKYLFGYHNLTSDAEEEEMLTVKRSDVINEFDKLHKLSYKAADLQLGLNAFRTLFGSKCLPDEDAHEDNFARFEPQPAEPKNEGTHQEQCVPKNAESGTHSFSHILKDGFREHNRLHIAAMAMQGLISKTPRFSSYEISNLVRISLDCADALIKKAEGGSDE